MTWRHREDGDTRQRQDRGAVAPELTGRWQRRLHAWAAEVKKHFSGQVLIAKDLMEFWKGRFTTLTLTLHKFRSGESGPP